MRHGRTVPCLPKSRTVKTANPDPVDGKTRRTTSLVGTGADDLRSVGRRVDGVQDCGFYRGLGPSTTNLVVGG